MIDTDKYEGHSEMINANEIGEIWEYLADIISEDSRGRAEANYNLVADAPDLLAEFKRLRDALRIARDSLVWSDEDFIVDEAFAEQIESVRDNIAQVLED